MSAKKDVWNEIKIGGFQSVLWAQNLHPNSLLSLGRKSTDNIIHHLVSIVRTGAGLSYQKGGSKIVATTWITEISSPFFHLRGLLKELGYRDTLLNLAADVALPR
ncbi:integral to membrane [Spatholobus suberectus]|nr:integral to membrane [Spatholobus suberectus]